MNDNESIKEIDIQLRLCLPEHESLVDKKYGLFIHYNNVNGESNLQYVDFSQYMKVKHIYKEPITPKTKQNTRQGYHLDSIYRLIWNEDKTICRCFQFYDIQQILIYCDIQDGDIDIPEVDILSGFVRVYTYHNDQIRVQDLKIENKCLCERIWVNPIYKQDLPEHYSPLLNTKQDDFDESEKLLLSTIQNAWTNIKKRALLLATTNNYGKPLTCPRIEENNHEDFATQFQESTVQPQNVEISTTLDSLHDTPESDHRITNPETDKYHTDIKPQDTYPASVSKNNELVIYERNKLIELLKFVPNIILLVGLIAVCIKLYYL